MATGYIIITVFRPSTVSGRGQAPRWPPAQVGVKLFVGMSRPPDHRPPGLPGLGGLRHPSPSPGPGSPGANSEPKLSGCACVGGGAQGLHRSSRRALYRGSRGARIWAIMHPRRCLEKSNHLIFIYLCLIPTCARGRVFLAFLQVILSALVTWVETYDGTSHDLELDGGGNTTYSAPPKESSLS